MESPQQIIEQLRPERHQRLYDILKTGIGLDVSDWSNYKKGLTAPAANPRYCYAWSFTSDSVVVLNLWHADLKIRDTDLVYELNMRAYAKKLASQTKNAEHQKRPSGGAAARARKMDAAISLAAGDGLPLRVIVCSDGKVGRSTKAKRVNSRKLDPNPWFVESYDAETGKSVLRRGAAQSPDITQDARATSIRRMVDTALKTVAQADGRTKDVTGKVKLNHFSTLEDFENYLRSLLVKQGNRCALSGLALQFDGQHTDEERLVSLDRIDSSGHYAPGNLQVVCRFVNRWKGADDNAGFKRLLRLVQSQKSG
jgi:hypothetical protein